MKTVLKKIDATTGQCVELNIIEGFATSPRGYKFSHTFLDKSVYRFNKADDSDVVYVYTRKNSKYQWYKVFDWDFVCVSEAPAEEAPAEEAPAEEAPAEEAPAEEAPAEEAPAEAPAEEAPAEAPAELAVQSFNTLAEKTPESTSALAPATACSLCLCFFCSRFSECPYRPRDQN